MLCEKGIPVRDTFFLHNISTLNSTAKNLFCCIRVAWIYKTLAKVKAGGRRPPLQCLAVTSTLNSCSLSPFKELYLLSFTILFGIYYYWEFGIINFSETSVQYIVELWRWRPYILCFQKVSLLIFRIMQKPLSIILQSHFHLFIKQPGRAYLCFAQYSGLANKKNEFLPCCQICYYWVIWLSYR